jgi:hypothetical protein
MALAPINPTQLTPPRVALIDPRSGAISREWYRFFLSLLTATQANQEETTLLPDTASLLATYDAMLATVEQASAVTSDGMVASLESSLNNLQNAFGVTPPDLGGTVTSVAASGGATGLTFTGSPITTSGTLTLGGTLAVANGGTGQTSYTDGQLLIGNSTGNTLTKATLIAGTNITITNGAGSITIASTAGSGTVTSVSVSSANGFAGTVANATTTPAITLSTTVTGIVKGNGTALSAAIAATDYVAPSAYASANGLTMATSRLLGRTTAGTGAAEEISVAGGLTLSGGVLTGASGTVTSVTGTSPVVSSGGTTPAISMPAASASVNGYLTSTDWTTFNNKGSGTVTSVTGTAPVVSSGGTTPAISMAAATASVNGYLTSTDWNTFNNKGSGTVTSVAALTLGTTGTDLSSTVANGTTTPVITLNVPTASAANRGALSSTDWSTFNNKQAALVSGTNIKTVGGVSLLGSGDVGTIGATYGGTGFASYAVGDILYASTTTALSTLADVATGNALISGGVGVAPSYGKIGLTTHISGTLAVGNGGTGATTLTSGYLLKGNGTSAVSASVIYDTGTNVGIGMTAPPQLLAVGNTTDQVGAGVSGAVTTLYFGTPSTSAGGIKRIAYDRATGALAFIGNTVASPLTQMTLDASGNLICPGVYSATVGATNRDVFVDNTGLIGYVPSILASKTNIADLTDTSWLDALRPIKFNYRKRDSEGLYTDEAEAPLEYGLIAEEVEKVNRELVFYDETENGLELRGVAYGKLMVPLLKEIQSLRARIAVLEGE